MPRTNTNRRVVEIPDPAGKRSSVSVNVERTPDALRLYVNELSLDMTESTTTLVPMTWDEARSLFQNLAGLLMSEMAVREKS